MSDTDQPPPRPVVVRSVWADNLDAEIDLIRTAIDKYTVVSLDTEFPGVVFRRGAKDPYNRHHDPDEHYFNLKSNVDHLNLIQIGLTIADEDGNLPDLGMDNFFIWEFNFRDFDVARDAHAHDSVELLKRQGIDFEKNRHYGVDSRRFAELMMSSGLVLNDSVKWVAFHGAYDFGYLVKCLTQRLLPNSLTEFLNIVGIFFGSRVYDVKHLMRFSANLYGGLDRACKTLSVERVAGKSHQAGSDSLLTLHAFRKIREKYFDYEGNGVLEKYANVLYGLEVYS